MSIETFPIHKLPGVSHIKRIAAKYYEQQLLADVIRAGNIPRHIAIILDGNRRFAESRGIERTEGHFFGAKKLEEVVGWCQELGIKHITVYAFSTENFNRPENEVHALMDLFAQKFREVVRDERVHRYKIRVRVIGNIEQLPENVRQAIEEAQKATQGYDGYTLNLAVGYGGRAELAEAVRRICEHIERGELKPSEVDEDVIGRHLYTAGLPDPDLIIRTSGEERLSGFLLWQSAYSELYFCEANWPEFTKIDFLRAIRTYQSRNRRFGR
ncbi:MAG: di-trans,poly-cis-decaprenylcistransferase [Hadesarchaea archaeon]|nr:MAG: di-trans,poly-cis-decaprenylcistransferase [Hadesarchaea archaeon]HDI12798.1 di-trans,poly-cis-decaprenylcistransferase [Hadesarchaea archaeon]